jgi:CRP-like cAMP-binding protein
VTADGREILLELRGAGEVIGELSAIDGQPRSATGTALDDTRVLAIPVDRFRELLATNPRLAGAVMVSIARRLREASYRQLEMGTSDALTRVCGRLVELAERSGADLDSPPVVVRSPISQQEIAEWAGVSRDAVVRSLKTLRDLGWIDTGRQSFRILDLDALRARAVAVR